MSRHGNPLKHFAISVVLETEVCAHALPLRDREERIHANLDHIFTSDYTALKVHRVLLPVYVGELRPELEATEVCAYLHALTSDAARTTENHTKADKRGYVEARQRVLGAEDQAEQQHGNLEWETTNCVIYV